MKFTLYRSNCLEVPENCTYPHKVEVTGKDSLIEAVKHDYVCAEYQGNYRSNDNFIGSDCLPVDCDNDHSDDPEEWVYPSDVATAFPGGSLQPQSHESQRRQSCKAEVPRLLRH